VYSACPTDSASPSRGLIGYHGRRIDRRSEGWFYSLVALAGLAVVSIVGLLGVTGAVPAWNIDGGPYIWIFDHIQAPMQDSISIGVPYSLLLLGNLRGNRILNTVSFDIRERREGKLAIEFCLEPS